MLAKIKTAVSAKLDAGTINLLLAIGKPGTLLEPGKIGFAEGLIVAVLKLAGLKVTEQTVDAVAPMVVSIGYKVSDIILDVKLITAKLKEMKV
jgi:hypothetical protein